MTLDFSLLIPSSSEKIYEKITDFENFSNYLPLQLQSVKLLQLQDYEGQPIEKNQLITEETIVSKSVLKTEFIQKSLHT